MNEADRASNGLIQDGKGRWEREVKWVNPNKGRFTIEKYLNDLWNQNNSEVIKKANANEFITAYWLFSPRSEEHTSELQSRGHLVCRLLLEKKKKQHIRLKL